ncbi:MAG: hypothetical protein MZW92_29865 [Comamonadaceae bacterium]|nr:hypothetical protein [Comamonadaceae bacterium]
MNERSIPKDPRRAAGGLKGSLIGHPAADDDRAPPSAVPERARPELDPVPVLRGQQEGGRPHEPAGPPTRRRRRRAVAAPVSWPRATAGGLDGAVSCFAFGRCRTGRTGAGARGFTQVDAGPADSASPAARAGGGGRRLHRHRHHLHVVAAWASSSRSTTGATTCRPAATPPPRTTAAATSTWRTTTCWSAPPTS